MAIEQESHVDRPTNVIWLSSMARRLGNRLAKALRWRQQQPIRVETRPEDQRGRVERTTRAQTGPTDSLA